MLEKIISERLNIDVSTITDESHIVDDLNADSLSVVEVIMDIESSYDIEMPDEDAENLFTVAEIKQWIEDNT